MPGTFVYTPAAGTVLSAGAAQSLSMTFTPTDGANYTTATANVTITVAKATPVITWANPTDIVYGTPLGATQLNATTTVAGTFVYTPGAGTVLTAGAAQIAVDDLHADRCRELHDCDEGGRDQRREGDAGRSPGRAPADIVYGTALSATQLNATTTVPGTFVYTPPAGTVLTAGTAQTLSVTFTPTEAPNYTTATKTVAINVLKATPVDHLGNARRDRLRHRAERDAAERDGRCARHVRLYAGRRRRPVAGAAQTLSVTFTPTDAANYTTAATADGGDHRHQGDPDRSPGPRRRTSPTARR